MSRRHKPPADASRRYHDRVARQYDAIYDDPYWAFHNELTWRAIKPHLPSDAHTACADLGCGTGVWGLRLLKAGFAVTFVDNAAAMVEQVRGKLADQPQRANRATLVVGDIVAMPQLPSEAFALSVAMGDPLSICSDPARAVREMFRITRPGGIVIATADNKLAAIDHFMQRGNLDALEMFMRGGKTNWLTNDPSEAFETTTFTPDGLRKLFEQAGFEVIKLIGKPVIPVRTNPRLLEDRDAHERLLRLEDQLNKDPAAAGRAAHLQVVAKRPFHEGRPTVDRHTIL